jgi:hypothetical protein
MDRNISAERNRHVYPGAEIRIGDQIIFFPEIKNDRINNFI